MTENIEFKATEMHAGDLTISLAGDVTIAQPSDEIFRVLSPDNEPLVIMYRDGRMEFGPSYTPDEAARIWWRAIELMVPASMLPITSFDGYHTEVRDLTPEEENTE